MSLVALPNELIDSIMSHLPLEDLATTSLLNHTWQACVFPHLNGTPCLFLEKHLYEFSQRLEMEDENSPLSLSTAIKGLVLYGNYSVQSDQKPISQGSLGYLNTIIPKIVQLRRFSWELGFVPEDLNVFYLIRTRCPNLDSIHVSISESLFGFYGSEQYLSIFKFTGLSAVSINSLTLPLSFDQYHITALAALLLSCPNLACLRLYLSSYGRHTPTYSPDVLVSCLGDIIYPSLHTFRIQGATRLNWRRLFEDQNTAPHSLRQFFLRHPKIKNLAFGWVPGNSYKGVIRLDDLARLFPSLTYFEGHAFLCKSIVASDLAHQLQSLTIVDDVLFDDRGMSLHDIAKNAKPLPLLRQLAIFDWSPRSGEVVLSTAALNTLLEHSARLGMLQICSMVDDYPRFIELLKRHPELRSLTVDETILFQAARHEHGGEAVEWEWLVPRIARICPRLRVVWNNSEDVGMRLWEVSRGGTGLISAKRAAESSRGLERIDYLGY